MKIFNKSFGVLAAICLPALVFTACEQEQNLDHSVLTNTPPTLSIQQPAYNAVFNEGDTTFVLDVTSSNSQMVDIPLYMVPTDNIGFGEEQFALASGEISKGMTNGSTSVSFEQNDEPSTMQKLTLQLGDSRTTANASVAPASYTYTVLDYDIRLSWGGLCGADFDLLFLDEEGSDIGFYDAATGDCPELGDLGGLPDGTYTLLLSLWSIGDVTAETVPVLFEASNNSGDALHTIAVDFDVNAGADVELGSIVVVGNSITLRNGAGTIVGTL